MSEQLKRCPFCGGEAILVADTVEYFGAKITCADCGATMSMYDMSKDNSIKGVTEAWNRRAEVDKMLKSVEPDEQLKLDF